MNNIFDNEWRPINPREYFHKALAGLDSLYLDLLVEQGAGHPVTEYVRTIRDECQRRLQESWYIV